MDDFYKIHKKCQCRQSKFSKQQRLYLKRIGLDAHAIRLYDLLLVLGPLTAQDAATHTFDFPSSHYRLFYELEDKELIVRLPGRPLVFKAIELKDGLNASLVNYHQELAELIKFTDSNKGSAEARIILGRQAVYDTYCRYATSVERQICIFSIGIAYSRKLHKVQQTVRARGVKIRHVVQEVRPANYHVVSKWQKIGVDVRYLKQNRGYHLTLVDDVCGIVTFSEAGDTENRISMLSEDKNVIAVLQSQFNHIWQDAKDIDLS